MEADAFCNIQIGILRSLRDAIFSRTVFELRVLRTFSFRLAKP